MAAFSFCKQELTWSRLDLGNFVDLVSLRKKSLLKKFYQRLIQKNRFLWKDQNIKFTQINFSKKLV